MRNPSGVAWQILQQAKSRTCVFPGRNYNRSRAMVNGNAPKMTQLVSRMSCLVAQASAKVYLKVDLTVERQSAVMHLSLGDHTGGIRKEPTSSGNGTRSAKHTSQHPAALHCGSEISTSSDIFSFPLSLLFIFVGSWSSFAQSCTVMWSAEGSVCVEKSCTSSTKSGFVEGL